MKAVIFDLNGVFIQSPALSDRIHADYEVPKEEFLTALSEIMDRVRRPGGPDIYEEWMPYLQTWNINLSREEFLAYWFTAEKENAIMTAFARELKHRGWKLFILSNNFKERVQYYRDHFPFLEEIFDKLYFSCETGYLKPSVEAFTSILREQEISPANCFYFDDSEKNVLVARVLGIHAHKFLGLDQVQEKLK
jgi:HAD superfamily hydrolase (TIGR01509 family)